jgi:recombinase
VFLLVYIVALVRTNNCWVASFLTSQTWVRRSPIGPAWRKVKPESSFLRPDDLLPDLFRLRAIGATLRDIAANLNERGIRARKGADWSQVQVKRLFDRVGNQVEFVIQRYSAVGWYDFRGGFDTYVDAEQVMGELRPTKNNRIEVYSKTV